MAMGGFRDAEAFQPDSMSPGSSNFATSGGPNRVSAADAVNDPNKVLSDVSNQQEQYYNDTFRPVNQELIGEVGSTNLVDTAEQNADKNFSRGLRRNERQRKRYGYTDTALDARDQQTSSAMNRGLNYDGLVNNSRVAQYERNVGLRNEMINTSRGISADAMSSLSAAAQMATQRNNTNDNLAAQNSAAKSQLAGSLAGMMMMFI